VDSPPIWLIAIALVAYGLIVDVTTLPWPPLLVLAVVAVVGNLILQKVVLNDIVDEVLDAGNSLVIRKGSREERIALADIVSVDYAYLVLGPWGWGPPTVSLSLRNPSVVGERVNFYPRLASEPFAPNPIIEDLIKRVAVGR
jgi:hypothetical protein